MTNETTTIRPIGESLSEYGRGIAGGLLFSLPLLYTSEVWDRGAIAEATSLLVILVTTFVFLLGYNRYGGIRGDAHFYEVMLDSIEEMGIGLLLSAVILWVLGRISTDMPLDEIVGKVVIEAMMVAIGVSIGTAQLGSHAQTGDDPSATGNRDSSEQDQKQDSPDPWAQLILGSCGALLIAANVAPTEEIMIIALEVSALKLVGLLFVSLAVCALILFYSGFTASDRHVRSDAPFWIIYGVVSSYAVSLLVSALLLWFFGRFSGQDISIGLAQVVVLAFPAVLGASAARLLIQ